jgi:hypothetical protein
VAQELPGRDDDLRCRVGLGGGVPEFYRKIAERTMRRKVCRLREFKSRRDLKKVLVPVLALMNECFRELYGLP